jgi:organic radical activating enzyme
MFYINEIFSGIQFEGALCGTPALFIRFHGCNLHCPFCDTQYAREGKGWPLDGEGLARVIEQSAPLKTVILTGGEPTIQPLVEELIPLISEEFFICVETNGTRPNIVKALCAAPTDAWITFSPKAIKDAEEIYAPMWSLASEIKVIFGTLNETLLAYAVKEGETRGVPLFMQPMEHEGAIDWEPVIQFVGEHPEWRMSFQLHKMLGLK